MWGNSKTLETLQRNYEQTGVMPPVLANRPELSMHNIIYKEAFDILSEGRQNSDHVINPISFLTVMSYCDCIGQFDGFERLRYWKIVNSADIRFISAMTQKRVAEIRKHAAQAKVANNR